MKSDILAFSLSTALLSLSTHVYSQYLPDYKDYNALSVLELQNYESLPGSQNIIYITTPGNTWTESQKNDIVYTLVSVSEDYRPFDVNVTTRVDLYNAAPTSNRIRYNLSFGAAGATGSCWYDAFGADTGCSGGARVAAHEIGHGMDSLTHDGSTGGNGTVYYTGNGYWFPIMGRNLELEYSTFGQDYKHSNNFQDDLETLGVLLGWRDDDHGNTIQNASTLTLDNDQVKPTQNHGIISNQNDKDYFKFSVSQDGGIDLSALPMDRVNNLHAKTTLLNSNGEVILNGNPIFHSNYELVNVKQGSELKVKLDPGEYFIKVENTGFTDSVGIGYPAYGSIGYFHLKGLAGDIKPLASVSAGKTFYCPDEKAHLSENSKGFNLDHIWDTTDPLGFETQNSNSSFEMEVYTEGHYSIDYQASNANGTSQAQTQFEVGQRKIKIEFDSAHNNSNAQIRIKNKTNDLEVILNSADYTTGTPVQEFDICLTNELHEIELIKPYDTPVCTSREWKLLVQYKGGTIVLHNGILWKANYTQAGNEPGVGGSPWTNMGECEYSDETVNVRLIEDGELLSSMSQKDMGANQNILFTLDSSSADVIVANVNPLQELPNSKSSIVTNSSPDSQVYEIYNLSGQKLKSFELKAYESLNIISILPSSQVQNVLLLKKMGDSSSQRIHLITQ